MSALIKLAVMAVGGQGGGVLANWVSDLAVRCGYVAQMTSVAGVAQRTGATIYYVEMAPRGDRTPVFALAPAAGDVDILIAAELMEAGRAVMRGFVTPDRTVVIASDHRVLAVDEKIVPGDGRRDRVLVRNKVQEAAKELICFDMEQVAVDAGSVISASLFGGLARSGALPFEATAFEEVIRASGRGVEASLRAFRGALEFSQSAQTVRAESAYGVVGPPGEMAAWQAILKRVDDLPDGVREMARAGVQKVVDYQDIAYGNEYLNRLRELVCKDTGYQRNAAKYIANALCYDDILRVADLKTRAARRGRVQAEQQISSDDVVQVTEYFHPRGAEFCTTLPAQLGQWIVDRPKVFAFVDRLVNRGRRLRTDGVLGFGALWLVAGWRKARRGTLRHKVEQAHLDRLIRMAEAAAVRDPAFGSELFACQRLIKGYSDTHARGTSKFDRLMTVLPYVERRSDAADWVRRLRIAALQDEQGTALAGAIATIKTMNEGSAACVE
jgi:indolepyruvate ferredoxin oxidoreductase beta subunit